MFMMSEFVVRPGSLNTHLYMLMEGHGYVSDYTPTPKWTGELSWRGAVGKNLRNIDDVLPQSAWSFKRYLTAKNYDVVGTDIINTLVGAPSIVDYTVTAIGNVFCNVLTSQQLNDILTFDVYPKLTAEVRKMAGRVAASVSTMQLVGLLQGFFFRAGWQVLKLGVIRLGTLAAQERRARFQYWQARRALQRLYHLSRGLSVASSEPVLPWLEENVGSDRITSVAESCDQNDDDDDDSVVSQSGTRRKVKQFKVGDHVEAEFRGKNYRLVRPAIVVGVHTRRRDEAPTSYMVHFTAKKHRVLHVERPGARVEIINREATMDRIESKRHIDDGLVLHYNPISTLGTVFLKEASQVIEASQVQACHKINSRVRVKYFRSILEGRICCIYTDGTYRIMYDYPDCKASVITWFFWRTDPTKRWMWCDADRVVVDIITSWRKMCRLDQELQEDEMNDRLSSLELPGISRPPGEFGSFRSVYSTAHRASLGSITSSHVPPKRRLSREPSAISSLHRLEDRVNRRIFVLNEKVDDLHDKMDNLAQLLLQRGLQTCSESPVAAPMQGK